MARVEVHPDRVVIRLTTIERLAAVRRRDVVIARDRIASAVITEDPWIWVRGVRAPGTGMPRALAIGTWRHRGGRDFVLARKGRAAVVIDCAPAPGRDAPEAAERGWVGEFDAYDRIIVSTVHAAELVSALRLEGPHTTTIDAAV